MTSGAARGLKYEYLERHVHAHEIRQGASFHFFHDPSTMDFNGALADVQIEGDDLVRFAGDDKIEDFAFTVGESLETICYLGLVFQLRSPLPVSRQGLANTVKEFLVTKRFLNKIDSAFLHRINRHWHIAVPGDKYDGQGAAAGKQLVLQFEAAETGHTNVEHEAARAMLLLVLQEFIGRGKNFVPEIDRIQQCLHCAANRGIVIDDINCLRMSIRCGHDREFDQSPVKFASVN